MSVAPFSTESTAPGDAHIKIPPLHHHDNGHERLASIMGLIPETAIFRRFATLNAKNILYYQAELAYLERRLKRVAEQDRMSDDEIRQQYCQAWFLVSHSNKHPNGSPKQWEIFERIRKILHEYSKSLVSATLPYNQLTPRRWSNSATARVSQDIQPYSEGSNNAQRVDARPRFG
jgi:hypothetical protein